MAGAGLAGEVGGYGLGLGGEGGEKVAEEFFVFDELGDLVAEGVDDGIALSDGIVFGVEDGADGEEAFRGAHRFLLVCPISHHIKYYHNSCQILPENTQDIKKNDSYSTKLSLSSCVYRKKALPLHRF